MTGSSGTMSRLRTRSASSSRLSEISASVWPGSRMPTSRALSTFFLESSARSIIFGICFFELVHCDSIHNTPAFEEFQKGSGVFGKKRCILPDFFAAGAEKSGRLLTQERIPDRRRGADGAGRERVLRLWRKAGVSSRRNRHRIPLSAPADGSRDRGARSCRPAYPA